MCSVEYVLSMSDMLDSVPQHKTNKKELRSGKTAEALSCNADNNR